MTFQLYRLHACYAVLVPRLTGRCHIILSSLSHMQAVVIPGPKGGEPNSYIKEGRRAYSETKQGPPIPYEGLGSLLLKPYNRRNHESSTIVGTLIEVLWWLGMESLHRAGTLMFNSFFSLLSTKRPPMLWGSTCRAVTSFRLYELVDRPSNACICQPNTYAYRPPSLRIYMPNAYICRPIDRTTTDRTPPSDACTVLLPE